MDLYFWIPSVLHLLLTGVEEPATLLIPNSTFQHRFQLRYWHGVFTDILVTDSTTHL